MSWGMTVGCGAIILCIGTRSRGVGGKRREGGVEELAEEEEGRETRRTQART